MPKKIKASYNSSKGYARHTMHSTAKHVQNRSLTCFNNITDAEEAEKKLYDKIFTKELELHNQKSRKKGNYGRIMTMDEWMKTERHSPIENTFKVGSRNGFIQASDLWDCYMQFVDWRNKRFGNNLILISAAMYVGKSKTPEIIERYVLYWRDSRGIMYTEHKKSLEQAGMDLPYPEQPEGRTNYRKKAFDAMCREKWLDIVEEMLQKYQDLELDRTVDQKNKKYRIGHLGADSYQAYTAALDRVTKTISVFRERENDLHSREEAIRNEKEALKLKADILRTAASRQGADPALIAKTQEYIRNRNMELKEQEHICKQRLTETSKRLLDAEKKLGKIRGELRQYYTQPGYVFGRNN